VRRALPALVLLTSACTITGTAVPVGGNLALVDAGRTGAALDAVKTAAEAVFSYDSGSPGAFDQAVAANVTGAAKGQLTALFEQVRKSPQPVHLVTRVREAAAVEFTGDRVRELAVLQQDSGTSKGLATVAFTAAREGGRWRLSDIAVNPAQPAPAPQPDDGSPGGVRDSVLAGARAAAGALFATDSADPEGSYARAEAVIADPLLSEYRAKKASYVEAIRRSGTKVALGPNPMAGVRALTGGRAVVLFFTTLQVTDATGKVAGKPFTVELDVVRTGTTWKATAARPVTSS
jgi:Mce-associated membrane protein